MYKTDPQKILYFLVFLLLLSACKPTWYYQRDPFYNDGSEIDHLRFPLIKPYYAILVREEQGWVIPLHLKPSDRSNKEMNYYLQIWGVQKIAVEKDIIMVYTPLEIEFEENTIYKSLHWFAILPGQKIETGFQTEEEFFDYVQQYGIDQPAWKDPDDLLNEYDQTLCLEWIPGCE